MFFLSVCTTFSSMFFLPSNPCPWHFTGIVYYRCPQPPGRYPSMTCSFSDLWSDHLVRLFSIEPLFSSTVNTIPHHQSTIKLCWLIFLLILGFKSWLNELELKVVDTLMPNFDLTSHSSPEYLPRVVHKNHILAPFPNKNYRVLDLFSLNTNKYPYLKATVCLRPVAG